MRALLLWLMSTGSAWAACPSEPDAALRSEAAAIVEAFRRVDDVALDGARGRLDTYLGCLTGPMPPDDAGTVHRAYALVAWFEDDPGRARRALAAVRTWLPDWDPSQGLVGPYHPLRDAWSDARPGRVHQPLVWPAGSTPWVDGQSTTEVPTDRAFVLQLDVGGRWLHGAYHLDLDAIPRGDLGIMTVSEAEVAQTRRRRRTRGRVLGASGSALLLGGSAWMFTRFAQLERELREAPVVDEPGMAATQARANRLSAGGTVAAISGAGLLAVSLSIPW